MPLVVRLGACASRRRCLLAVLCIFLAPYSASALQLYVYNNTALGLPLAQPASTLRDLSGPLPGVAPLQSVVVIGTLASTPDLASSGGINLTCVTDGMLRLWVDDRLVLDDVPPPAAPGASAPRLISSWLLLPPFPDPRPFRLEYTRLTAPAAAAAAELAEDDVGTVQLMWSGVSSAAGGETDVAAAAAAAAGVAAAAVDSPPIVVPASAYGEQTSAARAELLAMRQRLYEPAVPWQTYYASSMTAHVLQPTGLVVHATLQDLGTGDTVGDVKPFQRFAPAHVVPGAHSANGSDFTNLTIGAWVRSSSAAAPTTFANVRRNATVTITTTTGIVVSSPAAAAAASSSLSSSPSTSSSSSSSSLSSSSSSSPSSSAIDGDVPLTTAAPAALLLPCNGTQGSGGGRCDLVLLATCVGADCGQLALRVAMAFAWSRVGVVSQAAGGSDGLLGEPAGFPAVGVSVIPPSPTSLSSSLSPSSPSGSSPPPPGPALVIAFKASGTTVGVVTTGSGTDGGSGGAPVLSLEAAQAAVSAAALRAAVVPDTVAAAGPDVVEELYVPGTGYWVVPGTGYRTSRTRVLASNTRVVFVVLKVV